jgi:hypothetical protein
VVWAVSLSTTKLSPRRLTHRLLLLAFAVCLGLVTSTWPLAHAALYLQKARPVAAPQCISGRTSYLHVRLAFHPYPQLIPQFCNTGGCGPRRTVTSASPWPWIAHVVSGPIVATLSRPLQTRFPSGSPALALVTLATTTYSPDHSTKGTPSALSPTTGTVASDCLSVRGFRHSFIPLSGCFSPFPHGTCSLSVAEGIEPWRVVPPASHKLTGVRGTQDPSSLDSPTSTGLSPPAVVPSSTFESVCLTLRWSYNPI